MNTLFVFCAPVETVLRAVDVVLAELEGFIEGPIIRSVLSSSLDTSDGVVAQSGGRVRMETDQHHGLSGGWATTRTGKAGRWVIWQTDTDVSDLKTVSELFGPVSGGPPSVDEPIWKAVCDGRHASDLHVLSLGRIDRKVWVAHDGDGGVYAEVVFDLTRSLGTHEVVSELFIRFESASDAIQHGVTVALKGLVAEHKATDPPGQILDQQSDRAQDRAVAVVRSLADELDDAHTVGKIRPKQRRKLVQQMRSFLALVEVLSVGQNASTEVIVNHGQGLGIFGRLEHVATTGDHATHGEAWMLLAENMKSSAFERWAKAEHQRFCDRFIAELRSLVSDGGATDVRGVASQISHIPSSELEATLMLEIDDGRKVLASIARKWKHDHRFSEKALASFSMRSRRLTVVRRLLETGEPDSAALAKVIHDVYAYDVGIDLMKERLFESNPSASVIFDAARAIERDTLRRQKLGKRVVKAVELIRI